MLVSLQSRMALLACGVLGLLSGLGVEARPKAGSDVSKRFGDFHILVIANPGNSCADVGEGEMCACRCHLVTLRFLTRIDLAKALRFISNTDVPDDDPDNAFFGYCGPDLICVSPPLLVSYLPVSLDLQLTPAMISSIQASNGAICRVSRYTLEIASRC